MNKKSIQLNTSRFSNEAITQIQAALAFAQTAHAGQKRQSGEDYITHPIAVAARLESIGMDAETIMAALLHDTVEDCHIDLQDIEGRFGTKVAELVDGVTKIGTRSPQ